MAEESPKFRLFFRYLCCLLHLIGITYHCTELDFDAYKIFGGRFKFLTFLNMILQWIYFTSSVVSDVQFFIKKRKSEVSSYLCDLLFAAWVFPIGLIVTLLFWGLYMVDPYSCQNEKEAKLTPVWLNHYMHSFPGIAVMLEQLLFKHEYPTKRTGIKAVLGFGILYTAWVFLIVSVSDFWVYPFLQKMTLPSIAAFFGASYILLVSIYLTGHWLATRVPAVEQKQTTEKKID
ncbi:androgen-dependent TFPI-regulating protein-like [Actinia tenebrosa]|uniref:Androgen-dependent TFPI-regulating protein-like n=1 Tax=Actinia tenebrosa TaxID=6105 RepID=A0A6P8H850_ACTTE|nr:androgen-dependent TFPI-regulating protein-like [Actinia tenebrosa]